MKRKVLILLIIILGSMGYAIWKNSTMIEADFDDVQNQIDTIRIGNPEENFPEEATAETPIDIIQYEESFDCLEDLYEASDVVAIVQPVSRQQKLSVVNTVVEIKKNYKSELVEGDHISLFEQYHMQYNQYQGEYFASAYSDGGYIPMDMDKEYLVFLRKSPKYELAQYGYLSLLYGNFPYLTQEPNILELEQTPDGIREISFDELYAHDVVLINFIEDEERPSTDLKKEQRQKYVEYKENYMRILEDLIENRYQMP